MSKALIQKNLEEAQSVLSEFLQADNVEKIWEAAQLMAECNKNSGKIISCGNGGSMCDAMHFAEELTGRFRKDRKAIAALSISDPSHISCVGNDYGYDQVFSRYLSAIGNKNDVLLAISTSGNSENVYQAVKVAKEKEMKIVGLTGKDGGKIGKLCEIEIRAPYSEYADRAQEIHIKVIHSLIHSIEQILEG